MPRNISLSLSGTKNSNSHVLVNNGNSNYTASLPIEVIKFKATIMKLIIIPFMSKNWNILEENLVFVDNIKINLNRLISRFKYAGLDMYKDLIDAFETVIFLHIENTNLEEKLYGSDCNTTTLVFRTVMIRLKPELELYNLVFGKPNLRSGESYNTTIISDIEILLKMNNVTFDQIKKYLINKYQ